MRSTLAEASSLRGQFSDQASRSTRPGTRGITMARPTPAARLGRALARTIRLAIGIVLIVIGILGVILPLLPATPFFLLATLVIGKESRLMRHFSIWGKRRLRRLACDERALVRRE